MSGPTEIYVVTRGDYSAYGIMRVFLDKTAAEDFVKIVNEGAAGSYDDAEIEIWIDGVARKPSWTPSIPSTFAEQDRQSTDVWKIEIYPEDEGLLHWYWQSEANSSWEISEMNSSGIWVRDNEPDWIQVYARDLEQGKKVVHDLVAEHKAKKAGLT